MTYFCCHRFNCLSDPRDRAAGGLARSRLARCRSARMRDAAFRASPLFAQTCESASAALERAYVREGAP